MAGKDNLINLRERTIEEQREIQKKGGKASGKARRQKKTYRMLAKELMPMLVKDAALEEAAASLGYDGELDLKTCTFLGIVRAAIGGDIKAFDKLVELLGEQGGIDGSEKEQAQKELVQAIKKAVAYED